MVRCVTACLRGSASAVWQCPCRYPLSLRCPSASQSFDTETECTVSRGTGWCLQGIVPAQGKVGGGGVLGNRLHHEGSFAIGTLVERWWPHHGGWNEAKVTAYSKGSHMYAPCRSFAAAAEASYCKTSVCSPGKFL